MLDGAGFLLISSLLWKSWVFIPPWFPFCDNSFFRLALEEYYRYTVSQNGGGTLMVEVVYLYIWVMAGYRILAATCLRSQLGIHLAACRAHVHGLVPLSSSLTMSCNSAGLSDYLLGVSGSAEFKYECIYPRWRAGTERPALERQGWASCGRERCCWWVANDLGALWRIGRRGLHRIVRPSVLLLFMPSALLLLLC